MHYHSFTYSWFFLDSYLSYGLADPHRHGRSVQAGQFRCDCTHFHEGARMLRRWCIPLAGLALAAGALAASAPAAASSHPAGHAIHLIRPAMHGTAPMAARGRASNAALSTNWSG